MGRTKTAGLLRQDRAWVTAAEWFAGGQRIGYDPDPARVLTEEEAARTPGALRVFERVAGTRHDADAQGHDADAVWLTLLPGFPDGSYGGSDEDPYEHRQIAATRERVPRAEVLTFPGGHLTTSEHPDLLAAAIRDIAARHGVGTPAAAHR